MGKQGKVWRVHNQNIDKWGVGHNKKKIYPYSFYTYSVMLGTRSFKGASNIIKLVRTFNTTTITREGDAAERQEQRILDERINNPANRPFYKSMDPEDYGVNRAIKDERLDLIDDGTELFSKVREGIHKVGLYNELVGYNTEDFLGTKEYMNSRAMQVLAELYYGEEFNEEQHIKEFHERYSAAWMEKVKQQWALNRKGREAPENQEDDLALETNEKLWLTLKLGDNWKQYIPEDPETRQALYDNIEGIVAKMDAATIEKDLEGSDVLQYEKLLEDYSKRDLVAEKRAELEQTHMWDDDITPERKEKMIDELMNPIDVNRPDFLQPKSVSDQKWLDEMRELDRSFEDENELQENRISGRTIGVKKADHVYEGESLMEFMSKVGVIDQQLITRPNKYKMQEFHVMDLDSFFHGPHNPMEVTFAHLNRGNVANEIYYLKDKLVPFDKKVKNKEGGIEITWKTILQAFQYRSPEIERKVAMKVNPQQLGLKKKELECFRILAEEHFVANNNYQFSADRSPGRSRNYMFLKNTLVKLIVACKDPEIQEMCRAFANEAKEYHQQEIDVKYNHVV